MYLRIFIFSIFELAHLSMAFLPIDTLAPLFAGSIYLPLMLLEQIGLPVFAAGASGGWSSPSALGLTFLVILWTTIWWTFATFIARYVLKRWTK